MNFWYLISEDGQGASVGRIAFWIVFGLMVYFWGWSEWAIDPSIQMAFDWLLGYNVAKKIIDAAKDILPLKK